ncbi:hypothetical protein [Herbaspirillum sp. SJZ107]|uniref:hypothetical protein n=1 Tax=Herbaspirillum sp. SJZ107 TaxID=2572881 RepID=UPI00115316DC|nr:hypothetical protein [Herbaspirillum sp. SJZ107]
MPLSDIHIFYQPPSHGWLTISILIDGQTVEIDASAVPNNPVEDLLVALDLAANGVPSSVWWHLEPDGYFMYFTPNGEEIQFKLVFAIESDRACGREVVETRGNAAQVLLPFWRFVREFQSHDFQEPHWPLTDYKRILAVKDDIRLSRGKS